MPVPMDSGQTAVARVRGLRKRFGAVEALAGLDLELRPGEILGLIGPSGSGKTSLARAVIGLLAPDSGEVELFGTPMPARAPLARVGYMAQADALYGDLSGLANLGYFARLQGLSAAAAAERSRELLDFVGLRGHERRPVRAYSGGMRKRLSLAVALVHRPELVVLDEPTVGVDPKLRRKFWDEFRRLASEGAALLVTTHVMDEAERCDRLALIFEGRVIAQGAPEEIRSRFGVRSLEDVFLVAGEAARDAAADSAVAS